MSIGKKKPRTFTVYFQKHLVQLKTYDLFTLNITIRRKRRESPESVTFSRFSKNIKIVRRSTRVNYLFVTFNI